MGRPFIADPPKTCEQCGRNFSRTRLSSGKWPSRSGYAARRFCGTECAHAYAATRPLSPKTRYRQVKRNGKTQSAHRFVMSQQLGRMLTRAEIVHHKNECKTDNAPSNLEVLSHRDHSVHHNQKHPLTKPCEVCKREFTPAPTKRARAKTCGQRECKLTAISVNQRSTQHVEAFGECLTVRAWSVRTGIKAGTIRHRLRSGKAPEQALSP